MTTTTTTATIRSSFTVTTLDNGKIAVDVLAGTPEADLDGDALGRIWPTEEEIARAAGVPAVAFVDATNEGVAESLYRAVSTPEGEEEEARLDAARECGRECAGEAWTVGTKALRGDLTASAAGDERGSIDALTQAVGGRPTTEQWTAWREGYEGEIARLAAGEEEESGDSAGGTPWQEVELSAGPLPSTCPHCGQPRRGPRERQRARR